MPRDGSGVYSLPPGTTVAPNTTIESSWANALTADLAQDANTDRPVVAGGTGASTAADAATNLSVVSYGSSQTLSAAQQSTARSNVSAALKGHIYGLTLSNNSTDATNDIDIAAGEAASTETNPVLMVLASSLTKRLDAAWAVGTGNGGLDTGTIADTTYHVWLIRRSDTGVVDALFSTSASSPTMPTNYDQKRRIGSIIRSSSAIVGFIQDGDIFMRKVPVNDVNSLNPGTSAVTYNMSLPIGVRVEAILSVGISTATTSTDFTLLVSDLSSTDTAPSVTLADVAFSSGTAVYDYRAYTSKRVMTNTSAQIRSRMGFSDSATAVRMSTFGWVDVRGRF